MVMDIRTTLQRDHDNAIMGIGHFLLNCDKFPLLSHAASAGLVTGMVVIAGCASYPGLSGLTARSTAHDAAAQTTAAAANPARASAVADIRAKAEAATTNDDGTFPNVFHSYGPDGASAMTRAQRLALEADLAAALAAQARATNPAEAERMKTRAALLRQLAQHHKARAEADIQAASQTAD